MKFGHRFASGIRLYFRNFRSIAPIVLTLWLPANILTVHLLHRVFENPGLAGEFVLGALFDALLDPIEISAVLMILSAAAVGTPTRYGPIMLRALSRWPKVFLAQQIAGIFVLLRLVLLIVPGIIAALRYYLVAAPAALEGEWPLAAMGRSAELTKGRLLQIMGTFVLFLVLQSVVSMIIAVPFVMADWDTSFWGDVTMRCLADVTFSIGGTYIYLFYVEGKAQQAMDGDLGPHLLSVPADGTPA